VDEAVQGHGMVPVIDIIEKLEFSREELEAEEYARLSRSVEELYGRIVTAHKPFKRFARRIVAMNVVK